MGSKSILQSSPATFDRNRFCDLIQTGRADALVVNFSDYTYSFDSKAIGAVREIGASLDKPMAIVVALRGLPETEEDYLDLQFGIKSNADYLLLPIVKSAREISVLRAAVRKFSKREFPVLAQIDNARASLELKRIMKIAEGILLDPGDTVVPSDLHREPDAVIMGDVKRSVLQEDSYRGKVWMVPPQNKRVSTIAQTLLHLAQPVDAEAVVVGDLELAGQLSALRQDRKIVLASKDPRELAQAALLWGITPLSLKADLGSMLKGKGLVQSGRRYINATQKSAGIIESMA